MKTLKELKEKCSLLLEHKQNGFIVSGTKDTSLLFREPSTCKIFTDNKSKFYVYLYINKKEIIEYENYNLAFIRYCRFITNTCKK